jgi:hypothetical protein
MNPFYLVYHSQTIFTVIISQYSLRRSLPELPHPWK